MNSCGLLNKLCNHIIRLELLHSSSISRTKIAVDTLTKQGNEIIIKDKEKRLVKVAIVGAPNSGKSTLINQIVQRRVFPMSKKVHTTRYRARAVYNENNTQVVFLDTPGLVTVSESEKYKLKSDFITGGEEAIVEADIIGVVHDLSNHFTKKYLDKKVLRLLHFYKNKESILILNKVDTIKSKRNLLDLTKLLTGDKLSNTNNNKNICIEEKPLSEKNVQDLIKNQQNWENFSNVFMTSALLGSGTIQLKTYLINSARSGDWIFPEEAFTDQSHKRLIQETVRSKLLEYLPQEIPYNIKVELEYLDLDQEDKILAVVTIRCHSPRIEKIVKGYGGSKIKTIAVESEQALADAFLTNFHLRLVVCSNQL